LGIFLVASAETMLLFKEQRNQKKQIGPELLNSQQGTSSTSSAFHW